jgi:hypothetical protein
MGQVTIIGPEHRPHQQEAWDNQERFNILAWHRRAGKTVYAIKWLIKHTLRCDKPRPRGAYLAPLFRQSKAVAWQYVKDYCRVIPGVKFNESELRAIFPTGAEIQLLGANEPDGLRGLYLDAVVADEMADWAPRAWTEVIRPALADRKGKALLIGTVKGRANLFYDYYNQAQDKPNWYRQLLTVEDTDVSPAEELEQIRLDMDPMEYNQEMMCDWDSGVKGSFYGEVMTDAEKNRVGAVPHDEQLQVDTSWDLGMADSTVIWCWQTIGSEIRAIEVLEFQNTGFAEIVRELRARPYNYRNHYLPHDAKVRELGTGQSRVEILRGLGLHPTVVKNLTVQDGIQATRAMLSRCWFDREKCFRGIEALKTYRADYNDERQVFNKTPLHTWESHFADAVRYYAVGQPKTDTWGELDYSDMNRAVI